MIFTSTSRGRQFVACAAASNNSACSHLELLEQLVVKDFRENLTDRRYHAEAMKAYHAECAALAKKNSGEKIAAEEQISRLTVQVTRLVDAIENSDKRVKELIVSIEAKEAERLGSSNVSGYFKQATWSACTLMWSTPTEGTSRNCTPGCVWTWSIRRSSAPSAMSSIPSWCSLPATVSRTWSTPKAGCRRSWASSYSRPCDRAKKSWRQKGLALLCCTQLIEVKCNAATLRRNSMNNRSVFFSSPAMRPKMR
jgi:hypothetical protein